MKNRRKYANDRSTPKDPYWSLWGKLKARHERARRYLRTASESVEDDLQVGPLVERYEEEKAKVFYLPMTGVQVDWDGRNLFIDGFKKEIRADAHAVNSLRKYDTDADYRTAVDGGG